MIIKLWTLTHVAVMLALLAYLNKLSKHTENISRKYLFYAMTGISSWVFFDFILSNSASLETANIAFNLVLLSVSIAFGFFFLSCLSFTRKCTFKCKLVAALPLLVYLLLLSTTSSTLLYQSPGKGFQVRSNAAQLIWILTGDSLIMLGIVEMLKLKMRVSKRELKKKITYFTAPVFIGTITGSLLMLLTATAGVCSSVAALSTSVIFLFTWLAFKSPKQRVRKEKGKRGQ